MRRVLGSIALFSSATSLIAALMPIKNCGVPLDLFLGADSPSPLGLLCRSTVEDRTQLAVTMLLIGVTSAVLWVAGMFRRPTRPQGIADDLPDETVAWLNERALAEGLTVGAGDPDRSGMLWLALAYCAWYMPRGWRPVDS